MTQFVACRPVNWCLLFVVWIVAVTAAALEPERVPIDSLGDLELVFQKALPADTIAGTPLRASVRYRAGDAFSVPLHMAAQRIEFLVNPGEPVEIGEPVLRLSGPEVRHWLLETSAIQTRFQSASERYERNKPLWESGALSAAKWLGIQSTYFELKVENEHRKHVLEHALDVALDKEHDGGLHGSSKLTLSAPLSGTVNFDVRESTRQVGEIIFEVLPPGVVRLKVEIPWRKAATIQRLSLDECNLELEHVSRSADGFFITAWSEPLTPDCDLPFGTILSVVPHYGERALSVPKEAVFSWKQSPHVFVRENDWLEPRPVSLLGEDDRRYSIKPSPNLQGGLILTRSVSAAQGVLLGLGGE